MDPGEFARLVQNVRMDGRLTSVLLGCQLADGTVEMLSGHHRRLAAIEVGLDLVDIIVITTPLSEDRKNAIQLSHNSVTGKDNPTVLADMYRSLGLDAKMFSGLTDEVLELDKLTISGFSAGVKYEELRFAFLPQDRAAFEQGLNKLKTAKAIVATHLARYSDFTAIFDALIAIKERKGVVNSALALAVMAELALERLEQMEPEAEADGVQST